MQPAVFSQPLLHEGTRQTLIDQVLGQLDGAGDVSDQALMGEIVRTVTRQFSQTRLSFKERQDLSRALFHAMRGLDLLQPLLDHPQITEIMVNGPNQIFFEQNGQIHPCDLRFDSPGHLTGVIANFFGRANRLIHESKPLADMRLPDGSRVHAALPPVAPDGPVLTIRKFTGVKPDLPSLIQQDFISAEAAAFLVDALKRRQNLFLCGGTGTGKTTFLNILAQSIPKEDRVITIEDASELNLSCLPDWVRLEARQPGPDGQGGIPLSLLIRAALRMRPDRIIVGEVRGPEAFDMLQAMNTGHPGSLSTGHANSCHDLLNRLALMVLMGVQLPWDAVHALIASALDVLVHLSRTRSGGRQVQEICRLQVLEGGQVQLIPLFARCEGGALNRVTIR